MASRRGVKRRRSQALGEDLTSSPPEQPPSECASSAEPEQGKPVETLENRQDLVEDGYAPSLSEPTMKQLEVWDSFREENYEGISVSPSDPPRSQRIQALEQLPLSLHRSFRLILELDQQTQANSAVLLSTVQSYLDQRKHLAGMQPSGANPLPSEPASSPIGMSNTPRSPLSPSPGDLTTRDTLSSIARLSEEVSRAANEKVSLARFTSDLVDRYIRDLERAIQEQETSISLGLRPGTHPASIILPPVVVPKGFRRPQQSPPPEEDIAIGAECSITEDLAPTSEGPLADLAIKHRKRIRGRGRWTPKKRPDIAQASDQIPEELEIESSTEVTLPTLKLTVPPLAAVISQTPLDTSVDPNEPRYCYCNQVSYGEMIGCDNKQCEREWFHLGCVGLTQAPKGKAKWFCQDCAQAVNASRKKKG